MKAELKVDLIPLNVPDFVGYKPAAAPKTEVVLPYNLNQTVGGMQYCLSPLRTEFALHELEVKDLEALCAEFRASVFKKAGKVPKK